MTLKYQPQNQNILYIFGEPWLSHDNNPRSRISNVWMWKKASSEGTYPGVFHDKFDVCVFTFIIFSFLKFLISSNSILNLLFNFPLFNFPEYLAKKKKKKNLVRLLIMILCINQNKFGTKLEFMFKLVRVRILRVLLYCL